MKTSSPHPWRLVVAIAFAASAWADGDSSAIEEVVVTARAGLLGFGKTRASTTVDAALVETQAPATDVLHLVNRLPGVNVQFGDAIGGNNWSTRVSIRGMANTRDTSQIGYMVDRMPGGDPAYGGGQKPNVFVDAENVALVEVAQNTADVGSASNTALGGTLHYQTRDPRPDFGLSLAYGGGRHGLRRAFGRLETGKLIGGLSSYVSYSETKLRPWINKGAGTFERKHLELKVVRPLARNWTAALRGSWNYRNETDYDSVTLAEFRRNPKSDGLIDAFDIHNADRWRPGWGGTRWDKAAALELRGVVAGADFEISTYAHAQRGWGWWIPPYRIATVDGHIAGPQGTREYFTGTFNRTPSGALVPAPGTDVSHLGCLAGLYDNALVDYAVQPRFDCADAERIASRRRSGYRTNRQGLTAEARWHNGGHAFTLGGWLERRDRRNDRKWFDLRRANPGTLRPAPADLHWIHFDRRFDTDTTRLYAEYGFAFGPVEATAGLVFHDVATRYAARLEGASRRQAREQWLPKFGAVYRGPAGSELFAAWSRNVRMLADRLLAGGTTDALKPELADNADVGVRWNGDRVGLVVQAFTQRFRHRLGAVNVAAEGGDQYLQGAVELLNIGGVRGSGFELAAVFDPTDTLRLYGSYSWLRARYTEDVPAEGIHAGGRLANAPATMWFGELTWSPRLLGAPFQMNLNVKFVGDRPGDPANTETVPSYTVVGFGARHEHPLPDSRRLTLQLNASNIVGEQYLSAPDGDQGGAFFIGAPRMLSLTASVDL